MRWRGWPRQASPRRWSEREFNALFIGLGRGELLPYASYYLTGFLNEKPLASLRHDMAARGMTRAPNVYEPEDNIASLMEMMAGMIVGRFGAPATLADQRDFFNKPHRPLGRGISFRSGSGEELGLLCCGRRGWGACSWRSRQKAFG